MYLSAFQLLTFTPRVYGATPIMSSSKQQTEKITKGLHCLALCSAQDSSLGRSSSDVADRRGIVVNQDSTEWDKGNSRNYASPLSNAWDRLCPSRFLYCIYPPALEHGRLTDTYLGSRQLVPSTTPTTPFSTRQMLPKPVVRIAAATFLLAFTLC